MSKAAEENSKDMLITYFGTGGAGLRSFSMMLHQTKVFEPALEPGEVEARNAGMRLLYTMLGGSNEESARKLIKAIIKGLGAEYEDFKEDIHKDSLDKESEGE
jgi:hypothetical protein